MHPTHTPHYPPAHHNHLTPHPLQLDVRAKDAKKTVKQLATKGDVKSARILAREVVRVDRQKDRMSVSKARLGSINYQLQQQLGE